MSPLLSLGYCNPAPSDKIKVIPLLFLGYCKPAPSDKINPLHQRHAPHQPSQVYVSKRSYLSFPLSTLCVSLAFAPRCLDPPFSTHVPWTNGARLSGSRRFPGHSQGAQHFYMVITGARIDCAETARDYRSI